MVPDLTVQGPQFRVVRPRDALKVDDGTFFKAQDPVEFHFLPCSTDRVGLRVGFREVIQLVERAKKVRWVSLLEAELLDPL